MHDSWRAYRRLSVGLQILLALLFLVAVVIGLSVLPNALAAVGIAFAMLIGFAICALPFAFVIGVVWLIVRASSNRHQPAYYMPPGAYAPNGARPAPQPPYAPTSAQRQQPPGHPPAAPPAARRQPATTTRDLPPKLAAIAARVIDKANALRHPSQWSLLFAEDQQHVERTTNEYLPAILATYRGMPKGSEEWAVQAGGPTVLELVEQQLRLLEESLDAVAERVFKAGAAQLLAQQQFLNERLNPKQESELSIR